MPQLGCFFYGELDGQGDRRINSLFPKHIIKKDGRISSIFTLTVSIHFYFFCQVIRRVFWVSQTHKPHPTNHFSCACACVCVRVLCCSRMYWRKHLKAPVCFSAALLLKQLPVDGLGYAAEDGTSAYTPASHHGDVRSKRSSRLLGSV